MAVLSVADQVAARLLDRIRSGEITHRLPSQAEIAAFYGVNARSVGHAIRQLEQDGHIDVYPYKGAYVKGTTPATDRRAGP